MFDFPQPLVDAFWATAQALLAIVLPTAAFLAVGKGVELVADLWDRFKKEHPATAWEIVNAADIAVKAAEQQGLTGELFKWAVGKKDYAIRIAQAILKANGVKVDLVLLDAMIEAKVLENFPKKPAAGPATEPVG
ncbi:MAG TPA: hypothetical protein PLC98_17090 [Anaerolineales bacterium]|nr:hypothetical protein [Anaerolineales bacterium]